MMLPAHLPPGFSFLLLLLGPLFLTGCQTSASTQTAIPRATPVIAESPLLEYASANVETVHAVLTSHSPPVVTLTVRGLLNDGATRIHKIDALKTAEGFDISITTSRERSAMATLALVPFERLLKLNLSGMKRGPCVVRVNQASTTFIVP